MSPVKEIAWAKSNIFHCPGCKKLSLSREMGMYKLCILIFCGDGGDRIQKMGNYYLVALGIEIAAIALRHQNS